MSQSALNLFDGIVYINLDKRKDRMRMIENEFKKVDIDQNKVFRIEGYYDELNGIRGCVYSHIQALDFALSKKWKNVLLLEDDCLFTNKKTNINKYITDFFNHFKNDWDVFFLGTNIRDSQLTSHPAYVQVLFSVRAHAYAVNQHYLFKLKTHFVSTYESMKNDLFFTDSLHKALDRQWINLQKSDRWFSGINMIVQQRKSFSDIEKAVKLQR